MAVERDFIETVSGFHTIWNVPASAVWALTLAHDVCEQTGVVKARMTTMKMGDEEMWAVTFIREGEGAPAAIIDWLGQMAYWDRVNGQSDEGIRSSLVDEAMRYNTDPEVQARVYGMSLAQTVEEIEDMTTRIRAETEGDPDRIREELGRNMRSLVQKRRNK